MSSGANAEPAVGELDLATFAVRLGHACLKRGLASSPANAIDLVTAAGAFQPLRPRDLYLAARALYLHGPRSREAFDAAFAEGLGVAGWSALPARGGEDLGELSSVEVGPSGASGAEGDLAELAYSWAERLGARDLASLSADELVGIDAAIDALVGRPAVIVRRRLARGASVGGPVDVRRSMARSRRDGGELVELVHRRRRTAVRPVVVLLDVSGSMEPYLGVLLRLVHAFVERKVVTEVFTLGTRLTRVTRALETHDRSAAVAAVGAMTLDLAGGTRLGATLATFNAAFGVRGSARGATVVVISDGLDRGDPSLLGDELARLARVASRVVWMNPLKGSTGYEPLARAMHAAMPSIDRFCSGRTLDAFAELLRLLADPRGMRTPADRTPADRTPADRTPADRTPADRARSSRVGSDPAPVVPI